MSSTSVSLLKRLREHDRQEAWERFVELYSPLIYHWARRQGISESCAPDLVQDVLSVLVVRLKQFEYDPQKDRFRGWLNTITTNKARDYQRKFARTVTVSLDESRALASDGGSLFEKQEYQSYLANRALELMKAEFKPDVWKACFMQVVEERKASDVASELGMSVNQVYLAKSRVLARLREELWELIS